MLKEFEFWLKQEDDIRSLYCLRASLRRIGDSRLLDHALIKRFRAFIRSWSYVNYHIISADPLVIVDVWQHTYFRDLTPWLPRDRPVYFLYLNWWHLESDPDVRATAKRVNEHRASHPGHRIYFLYNSARQQELFERHGLPGIFCNQNALLDEYRYRFMPEVPKKYDAVYTAVAVPCKRHYLASAVDRLALITYVASFSRPEYVEQIKGALRHADWMIDPIPMKNYIPGAQIPRYLNQARTGLCLSAAEGAMYASAEYMLCGLPVVSTKSIGGRDVFFDDAYVKIVDDDPEAVRQGVAEMIGRRLSPETIRRETLNKMRPHRERFVRLLQEILDKERAGRDFTAEWDRVFTNKMLSSRRLRWLPADIARQRRREERRAHPPRRILFVLEAPYPWKIGGAEKHALKLAGALNREDCRIRWVTPKTFAWRSDIVRLGDMTLTRLAVPFGEYHPLFKRLFYIRLCLFMLIRRRDYDMVNMHLLGTVTFMTMFARILGKVTLLKITLEDHWSFLKSKLRMRHIRAIFRRSLDCVDGFVVPSRMLKERLLEDGVSREKIFYIPNGTTTGEKRPSPGTPGQAGERPAVVFAGHFIPRKNVPLLINAWPGVLKQAGRLRLLLLGDGPQRPDIEKMIHRLGLSDTIRILGCVPDVTEHMHAADIFVLPSLREGCPNVLLEAMSCGMACIVSRAPGNEEIVQDGINGLLVDPENAEELAASIVRLARDRDLRRKMGAAAFRTIEDRFSIENTAERYRACYREVWARAAAPKHPLWT